MVFGIDHKFHSMNSVILSSLSAIPLDFKYGSDTTYYIAACLFNYSRVCGFTSTHIVAEGIEINFTIPSKFYHLRYLFTI